MRSIVGGAALIGLLPTMLLAASEGTPQIRSACVARVGEKANAAMHTMSHAATQPRVCVQHAVQVDLIMLDERIGAVVLVPIGPEGKNFLDRYDKKARFSVIIWSCLHTSSSYLIDAQASRGRPRFFFCALRQSALNRHFLLSR
jgi:hypothetical protein